jgi:hypothetical protein
VKSASFYRCFNGFCPLGYWVGGYIGYEYGLDGYVMETGAPADQSTIDSRKCAIFIS